MNARTVAATSLRRYLRDRTALFFVVVLPIVVVGLVRRIDLDRRRNHRYQAKAMLAPALVALLDGLSR